MRIEEVSGSGQLNLLTCSSSSPESELRAGPTCRKLAPWPCASLIEPESPGSHLGDLTVRGSQVVKLPEAGLWLWLWALLSTEVSCLYQDRMHCAQRCVYVCAPYTKLGWRPRTVRNSLFMIRWTDTCFWDWGELGELGTCGVCLCVGGASSSPSVAWNSPEHSQE